MSRHTRRSRQALAVLTAAACTLVAACGAGTSREEASSTAPANVPGITSDTITIGGHFPLTGVAAPGYSEIPGGAKAYFDYVNANGGINGKKIDFIAKDDGYNPTNTSTVVNELVLKDGVFGIVGGLGTPTHGAVVDFLNEQKVPDLFVSSGSRQWGETPDKYPYTFGWQPDYEIEGKIIGQWVSENMPDAKVGLFLQDDDFGQDGEKGVRQFIDSQIVETVKYTPGNTDIGPQIAKLQASGADFVIGFNVPAYTALSQLVALKLNYKPKWYYSNVGSDPTLVGALLAKFSENKVTDGAALLDGVMTTEYIPGVDAPDNAWVQLWQKVWDQYGDGGDLTNYRVYGMSWAYTFVQAALAAGDNLTRDGIVQALETKGGSFAGPGYSKFRYSSTSHLGLSGMQVVSLKGGVGEPLTKVLVTDLGDAPITEDDSQAGDAPPASGIPAAQ